MAGSRRKGINVRDAGREEIDALTRVSAEKERRARWMGKEERECVSTALPEN